jgi:diguanylate cyclase (GGDEF)-like protein
MILLDLKSLIIALSFSSAGLALTFFVSWFVSRTDRVLKTWAIGAVFLVVSTLAYCAFVNQFSRTAGIVSFTALLVGFVFFLGAAYEFRTGALPVKRMAVVALAASAITVAPMIAGYDGICYIVFNLAVMAILAATGWEYWYCRKESPLLLTTLSVLYVVAGVSFALCAAVLIGQQSWIMHHAPDNWAENVNLVICLADTAAIGALSLGLNQVRVTHRHKRDAETDALTGLFNRRAFFDRATDLRRSSTIAVVVFDIDHFKQINDIHGHPLGDLVLQAFASILAEAVREDDLAARLGGEEFAVLLPDAPLKTALIVAERVRKKFAERRFLSENELFSSSVSVGISKLGNRAILEELMIQADAALYVAKRAGRNRVILFSSRDDVRQQKQGTTPIDLESARPDHTGLYGAVAEAARHRSQRRGRLTRRI